MEHKKLNKIEYIVICLAAIGLEVAIDLITKSIAFAKVGLGNTTGLCGKMFTVTPVYNEVASLGLGRAFARPNIVFFVVTLIGLPLFCVLWWRSRTRSTIGIIGYVMCIGGTIGNAVDRLFVQTDGEFFGGKVRDFVSWNVIPQRVDGVLTWKTWYVNNIADDFLVVGIVLVLVALIFCDYDSLVKTSRQERLEKSNGQQIKDSEDETN